ncbi:MAG: threonine--tRNA ligase [Rickettsiales bacterium]|jgi:threonyl-tRNA synthetase|nr:threonine--tRNA ligase [Rickettsiales bacterium]
MENIIDIKRHSLSHVLAAAVFEIYGDNVLFAIGPAIENGFYYDIDFSMCGNIPTEKDFKQIEKKMEEILSRNLDFERKEISKAEALKLFTKNKYKCELINEIPDDENISVYTLGNFVDLCRGPHVASTKDIKAKTFCLNKIAGAYWRGDASREQLVRIYGLAFDTKDELQKYLTMLEEAEKRDHRKLGREMDLFHFDPINAPGAAFWHDKGFKIYRKMVEYMRMRQNNNGYIEVATPSLMDKSLWQTSGHWDKYGEHNYSGTTEDGNVFCVRPMNCPGGILVYKQGIKSYRDLPLRMAEFGKVHRYEASGALMGLMRVREFTQDDAHIFCTQEQLESEIISTTKLIQDIYKDFGFTDVEIYLSTRPEKRIGSDEIWDLSEKVLADALHENGYAFKIMEGEGAFYGPKLEFHLKDAIGRKWQCGTVQVDMNLPERFDVTYINEAGEKSRPIMLHRALFGSVDRFLGILLENYAGKLPFWLSPLQVVVAPISDAFSNYAQDIERELRMAGIYVATDLRNEKISYKIREHSLAKVNMIVVVGEKEVNDKTITVREIGVDENKTMPLIEFVRWVKDLAKMPSSDK